MENTAIDPTARIVDSDVDEAVMVREFCTIKNSVLGRGCRAYERVSIKKSHIGAGADINAGSYIENATIEADVQIAPNCNIVGVTHRYSQFGVDHTDIFKRIHIGSGSWIGAGATILPGVRIGKNVVVGAGALVNRDIPDSHVYLGTPLLFKLYPILEKQGR